MISHSNNNISLLFSTRDNKLDAYFFS